jgi:uncharacterized repeat protein (TIGR01451 family)
MTLPDFHRFRAAAYATLLCVLFTWLWVVSPVVYAQSEPHRATHLGNPATRFADPLKTTGDFRRVFLRESLQTDIKKILRMSDYLGDVNDFKHAVATAEIKQISIPVGTLLPAMSTRKKGEPVLLRNVLWAGKKPIDAFQFSFISLDRRYLVTIPKACSNFWVEEQLPRPVPVLELSCTAPEKSAIPKAITVCNSLSNRGEVTEALAMLSLQTPVDSHLVSTTGEAVHEEDGDITWTLANLAPGESQTRCATFTPQQLGPLSFKSAAAGKRAIEVSTQCNSQVIGIPAVLLEVVDLADPVLVGNDVTYVIRVLNQGTLPLTNVKIVARMEAAQSYISGSGATEVVTDGEFIGPGTVPLLNPQEVVEWRIVVKAEQAGDIRFNVGLHADQFSRAILETEATFQY